MSLLLLSDANCYMNGNQISNYIEALGHYNRSKVHNMDFSQIFFLSLCFFDFGVFIVFLCPLLCLANKNKCSSKWVNVNKRQTAREKNARVTIVATSQRALKQLTFDSRLSEIGMGHAITAWYKKINRNQNKDNGPKERKTTLKTYKRWVIFCLSIINNERAQLYRHFCDSSDLRYWYWCWWMLQWTKNRIWVTFVTIDTIES